MVFWFLLILADKFSSLSGNCVFIDKNTFFQWMDQIDLIFAQMRHNLKLSILFSSRIILNDSKTCHLRSLVWAIILKRLLYGVNLLCNSINLMLTLPLFCKATCLLWSIFVKNFSNRSKQVLL